MKSVLGVVVQDGDGNTIFEHLITEVTAVPSSDGRLTIKVAADGFARIEVKP